MIAVRYGWRTAFVVTGVLGLLWIPLWNWAARRAAAAPAPRPTSPRPTLLRDRRLWVFVLANGLSMVGYSLWGNWTTLYLVDVHRLTSPRPRVCLDSAGLRHGRRLCRRMAFAPSHGARHAGHVRGALPRLPRRRGSLAGHRRHPEAPSPGWTTAGISLSIFAVAAFSVNIYTLPLDAFGGPRAAFAVSILVASYGAIQSVISPALRRIIDLHGYAPAHHCRLLTPLPPPAPCCGSRGARALKQRLKQWIFRLLGKDPRRWWSHSAPAMPNSAAAWLTKSARWCPIAATSSSHPKTGRDAARTEKLPHRTGAGHAQRASRQRAAARAAYRLAPRKILAYNSRLERHHLRPDLASFLFWRGVPLDRIYLRPWWWPWPQARAVDRAGAATACSTAGPCSAGRRRVAVLSPYFPYPLSHGGAVRIYHLLREIAREFDVELFAFTDGDEEAQTCPRAGVLRAGRAGPQAALSRAALVHAAAAGSARVSLARHAPKRIAQERHAFGFELLQVEYTQLATYGGDILVEHDVTFDLFGQIARRERTLAAPWDYYRWHRYEIARSAAIARVVVMSPKDAALLGPRVPATIIENGVDLERFQPQPEQPGQHLLFIGSFRHFPNVAAYRFFTERVWPLLRDKFPRNARSR